jgi:uncharacterized protein (TIGR04255 family)
MAKIKKYKKPPLIEVVCEFQFEPDPDKKMFDPLLENFWKGKMRAAFPQAIQPTEPPDRLHRFASREGKTFVQIGENLLVVNQLPPYYGWERFEPVVVDCFREYARHWKPLGVKTAAIHYVNKIDIPQLEFELDKYFNLMVLPDFPNKPVWDITASYKVQGAQKDDVVVTILRQHPSADPEGVSFLITWNYFASRELPADTGEIQSWLRDAHDFQRELFLSTLTEECRKLFDQ